MKFVADLHLHSKYSRAVSQDMTLSKMAEWAKMKGINVLATGDFCHPFSFDQLKTELEDSGNGLYKLKSTDYGLQTTSNSKTVDSRQSAVDKQEIHFLLSCEISSIYSQGGKGRRIHNLFFFPSLRSVEKFNSELLKRGANLRSDGRPIVGISSRDLAKIALDIDDKALVIPAHAWTPWFSIFGSFSGFDSIEECFGDMAPYIYGIETGLSSDPAMNWQIADLDSRSILSFSDAHSLEKMGREATVFEADGISYEAIYQAIANSRKLGKFRESENSENQSVRISGKSDNLNHRTTESSEYSELPRIAFTIEFYPEEGKYHFTGHRNCNVSQSPEETAQNGDVCPVCGRHLTVGVMHRVKQLASHEISNFKFQISNGVRWVYQQGDKRPPYVSMVPLGEIIAEAFDVAPKTKKVMDCYMLLVEKFGSEFALLINAEISEIAKYAPSKIGEGIQKVRNGEITIEPGYDGKFGIVKIWDEEEHREVDESQLNLFA